LTDDDLQEIARRCDGWTGADLSGLVATASMAVMQRSVDLTRELRAMNIGAGRDDAKDIPQTYENFVVLSNGSAASSKHCKFNPETFASTIGPLMEKSSLKSNEKPVVSVEKVKIEDLVEAMGRTRRSLSDRDIDHQQRMYSKFMQSRKPGGDPLVQPGTRTTLA
jgi:SpoVK/Ycf46/Vps4 family AAA+-type ATPase